MSPATLAIVLALIQEGIKEYPAIRQALADLLTKSDPTPADWLALRDKVLAQSFESLAPHAKTE